jgi:hypothetical protein
MAKFRKDALYCGDWHLPDGRVFRCTPELRDGLARRLGEMREAGLHIPLAWEHQDDAVPLSADERRANRARFNCGFAERAEVSGGALSVVVDVPGSADAERLPSARFVSPEIRWDWRDGTGKVWEGPSITHIAVTPRPVQHAQRPFEPVSMSHDERSTPFRLSLDGYQRAVRMADDNDTDDLADDGGDGAAAGGDTDFADLDDAGGDEPAGGEDAAMLPDVLAVLARLGLVLPGDTSPSNLIARLHTAGLTMEHHTKGGDGGADDPNALPGEPPVGAGDAQPQQVQPQMPVGMSMSEANELKSDNARMKAALLKKERKELLGHVADLARTGRINKPIADDLTARITKVQLSLAADGNLVPNAVLSEIAAYQKLPEGCVMPAGARLSSYGHGPRVVEDPVTETDAREQEEIIAKMSGKKPAGTNGKA